MLGGKKVLLKAAGTDASKQFDAFHSPSVLQKLATKYEIGIVGDGDEEPVGEEDVTESNSNPLIVNETFGDMTPFGDPMWYADFYR